MAFNIQQIHPLDLQPRKAVGVSLPFSARSIFTQTYTTKDALKANIINFFLTEKGERFLNPNFGAGLRGLLFDQMTEDKKQAIEYTIRRGMADWFPNVAINSIHSTFSQDTSTAAISIEYRVLNTNIQDQIVINFEQ